MCDNFGAEWETQEQAHTGTIFLHCKILLIISFCQWKTPISLKSYNKLFAVLDTTGDRK